MNNLTILFVTIWALLLGGCTSILSTPNQSEFCPPTPIHLEWYQVEEGRRGVYLPEQSFKQLQRYIVELKTCIEGASLD
ncbi:hypothetical protein BS333_14240 [Vibrio azureus]|nr:hypothetical protein BS333_14240 [Vibrio azureus]